MGAGPLDAQAQPNRPPGFLDAIRRQHDIAGGGYLVGDGPDGQPQTPSNTGAAQFVSGPLNHVNFRNMMVPNTSSPQDFEGKFGDALSRYVSQQLNPGHIPGRQFSGNRGLLTERIA